jgi:hypothetical protein
MYAALPFVTGTVTTTGTGTSRTATASAGTPFATTEIVASATNTLASYLQTPQGLYQITARTSDTVVTISTLTTYVNEAAVAGTVWKLLFAGGASPNLTTSITQYDIISVQPAFTISLLTQLGAITFATSTGVRTVTTTYNGTLRNTHIASPLAVLHNQLGGLQGGTANEFYHSTLAEYTGTGTGIYVRATSPTLVTPVLGTPTSGNFSTGTFTWPTFNQDTTGKSAKTDALNSATTVVNVSSATAPSTGQVLTATGSTAATWQTPATGTVTSVAASVPSIFSISGSPITTSGTLAMTYSGTALPIANGGTNQTAFTAKSGNVAGLAFFDGTKLANDATVTDVGYDTTLNTLQAKNLAVNNGLVCNNMTVGTSFTIPSGYGASSVGPVTIASGVVVTVPSGSRWVVL